MKTYKGMTRSQLIDFCVAARVAESKERNVKLFGDGNPRLNENENKWRKFYQSYPITSKATPAFSLAGEYESLFNQNIKKATDTDDRIYKYILRCNQKINFPEIYRFKANIQSGTVYVECRGYETYIRSVVKDADGKEKREQFAGTTIATAKRLEMLQMDFDSIKVIPA